MAIAAGSLGRARYVEAKISSGTSYAFYVPVENQNAGKSGDFDLNEADKTESTTKTDYFKSLINQLKNDELFYSNPYLRSSLIQDVTSANLKNNIPLFLSEKMTKVADYS